MDYKEKYNAALERARELSKSVTGANYEYIFPELKEGGDERIRKALIDYFDDAIKSDEKPLRGIQTHEVIDWLEKQEEQPTDKIEPNPAWSEEDEGMLTWLCRIIHSQRLDRAITLKEESELGEWIDKWLNHNPQTKQGKKPANKIEPKFRVGDWIANGGANPCYVKSIFGDYYELCSCEGYEYSKHIIDVNYIYHRWTIADAKDGDVLVASDGSIFLFAGVVDCACKCYVALTTDNYAKINKEAKGGYWETSRAVYPATKEQRDLLFHSIKEAGYQWDSEKKELKKTEVPSKENNDEMISSFLITHCRNTRCVTEEGAGRIAKRVAWLEEQKEPEDKGEISDGYHTFNELYSYRMLYNAAFFNLLPKDIVHKSKRHHDGEECFGGGWFVVMANLPTGQISNHYELKDWDLFQIPEKEIADEWDGHTPQEAAERLHKYLLERQGEQTKEWSNEDEHLLRETIKYLEEFIRIDKKHFSGHGVPYCKRDIDWLKSLKHKRQSEQKPADKVEPKFHEGDWVVYNNEICQIIKREEGCNKLVTVFGIEKELVNERNLSTARLWSIQDAKNGDVLLEEEIGEPFIYNGYRAIYSSDYFLGAHCGIYDGKFNPYGSNHYWGKNSCPATKEQCDRLFAKMADAGYEWDADKKKLKKIESKKLDTDLVS